MCLDLIRLTGVAVRIFRTEPKRGAFVVPFQKMLKLSALSVKLWTRV